MDDAQKKAAALLALPDEQYFAFDENRLLKLQEKLGDLFSAGTAFVPPDQEQETAQVVAIGAPKNIRLERNGDIPLLVALRYTGMRQWEVDWEQNVRILAVDLETGRTFMDRPAIDAKRHPMPKPSMTGPPPGEIISLAVSSGDRKSVV